MTTILVVEDESDLLATLRAILEGEGFATETCPDGMGAIQQLRSHKPGLLLMDLRMPRLGGVDVALMLRHDPELEGLPVVLMSAAPPASGRRPDHCPGFLRKPFSLATLLATVEVMIGAPNCNSAGR
jgi:CheY-like chemotaxis protein